MHAVYGLARELLVDRHLDDRMLNIIVFSGRKREAMNSLTSSVLLMTSFLVCISVGIPATAIKFQSRPYTQLPGYIKFVIVI